MGDHRGSSLTTGTLAARTYLDGERANRPLGSPIVRGTIYTAPSAEDIAEKAAALERAESAVVFATLPVSDIRHTDEPASPGPRRVPGPAFRYQARALFFLMTIASQ